MSTPTIISINGHTPKIHATAFIAPNATIIGDVVIGAHSSVFYGCVLRGDIAPIRIGQRTNIQDNSVMHVDEDAPCILGDDVTVGHMALVHGATVGDGVLVGMKSTLLSHSVIGRGSLIAAGAVVLEHQEIPEKSLAAGVPAKVRRELSDAQSQAFIPHAAKYVATAELYHKQAQRVDLAQVRFE
ncbi:isoleucine patch superfamily enzyme, carbonic anhydrase/acetyltransferase [Corynebacterium kutscheri]|uniref:Isoleucine patch superfamily enzyme, carbonic anhydrase/acetyltransferase n=1 Tax=Corynebacterium kutscheri TaxID=35755 RepID=A0A0F6TCD4_9CORY|nr:gamma carbonic anhydrase family protein [Corynebacterium kutscheri]AKE40296.1 isoleucine patch superfamily enzyme, carbonic anhydrase/acetyltransferase [Corynebacterium kutscheri]VEH10688.1 gamma-type carbonic anhydratase-like protein [Corynebacterium kutscheri]